MTDTRTLGEPELNALMRRALLGERSAYRTLLQACETRLRVYFRRHLAGAPAEWDDLVQETLLAVHLKRATFDATQSFTAWLYAIARYKLTDHHRRSGRRRAVVLDDVEAELSTSDHGPAADARRDVERGLAALPERARDLVRRVKLDGEAVAEVAASTGRSEGAVKVAVHRAFKALAERLRGEGRGSRLDG